METPETQRFKAGEVWGQLPEGATNLHKVEFGSLTKTTQKNAELLGFLYSIEWEKVMSYAIIQHGFEGHRHWPPPRARARTLAHGKLIYGRIHDHPVTFFRRESTHPAAGQTLIYFGKGRRIQVSILLKRIQINSRTVPVGHLKEWAALCECAPLQGWLLNGRG